MTNYERIKNMSVDEMADALFGLKECTNSCPMSKSQKHCYMICDNESVIKKWLESEDDEK